MKYTQGQSVQKIVEGGDSLWVYTDDTATVVVTPDNVSANAVTTTVDRTDGVVKYGPYYKPTVVNVTATSLDADVRNYEFIANPTTEGEFGEVMAATGGMTPSEIGGSISQGKSATIPTGFNWPESLPDVIAYKSGNSYDCNIKPEDLIDFSQFTNVIYVDINQNDDAGDGSSWALAKKSLQTAVDDSISSGVPTRILVKGGVYGGNERLTMGSTEFLAAPVSIEAVYGRVITGGFINLSWSKTGGYTNIYETTRSSALQPVSLTRRDEFGMYAKYKEVSSLSDCDSESGTWYTDNVKVYVHGFVSEIINNKNIAIAMDAVGGRINTTHDFYLRGFDFVGGSNGGLKIDGGSTNMIVCDSVTATAAIGGASSPAKNPIDGFAVLGCGLFAAFDSSASGNSKDGFNFHDGTSKPAALLVNCTGLGNGYIDNESTSNNGITAHDGIKCIDIGGDWRGSVGTNAGHVSDGTQVWHFGSIAGDSAGDIYNGGSIDYGAFGVWSGAAEMWLDSCRSVGSIIGVKASGTAKAYIRDFSGTGSLDGNVENY